MEQSCRSVGSREQYGRMHWESDKQCGMLFLDCVYRNASMPSAMGDLILYVVFLVVTSYAIVFLFRMVLSLVKPVLIAVFALLIFRFLILYNGQK